MGVCSFTPNSDVSLVSHHDKGKLFKIKEMLEKRLPLIMEDGGNTDEVFHKYQ